MKLCRVLGNVTQTIKHEAYQGHKLLVIEPIEPDGVPTGASFLAIDHVQAGPGDIVLVLSEGTGVRQILGAEQLPIRSLIVGIVDSIDLADNTSCGDSAVAG